MRPLLPRLSRASWSLLAFALFYSGSKAEDRVDDSYRLYHRDVVTFSVYGEPDLNTQQRISGNGSINAPLLGEIKVVGLTLEAASQTIAAAYIAAEILLRPQITMQVSEYSKKEVSILGQIGRQGKVELPPESSSLNIIDIVSAAGGFSRIARSDSVRVTRRDPLTDKENIYTIDVESMIRGTSAAKAFEVLPGDIIFVPERLF